MWWAGYTADNGGWHWASVPLPRPSMNASVPLWKLVPLSEGPWDEGVCESWMACPFFEESLWASGSWVALLQVLFVDAYKPIVDLLQAFVQPRDSHHRSHVPSWIGKRMDLSFDFLELILSCVQHRSLLKLFSYTTKMGGVGGFLNIFFKRIIQLTNNSEDFGCCWYVQKQSHFSNQYTDFS